MFISNIMDNHENFIVVLGYFKISNKIFMFITFYSYIINIYFVFVNLHDMFL